jgi:hypothetical protein
MIDCAPIELAPNLAMILATGHMTAREPGNQSVRGGTQGNLEDTNIKAVLNLKRQILERHKGMKFSGIWSTALPKGGYHVAHNHPKGEISGVVYVSVPETNSGMLKFGGLAIPAQEGMMVTFPSTAIHEVTPYEGERPRIAVGFDLVRNG